jgi:hypothetical protein
VSGTGGAVIGNVRAVGGNDGAVSGTEGAEIGNSGKVSGNADAVSGISMLQSAGNGGKKNDTGGAMSSAVWEGSGKGLESSSNGGAESSSSDLRPVNGTGGDGGVSDSVRGARSTALAEAAEHVKGTPERAQTGKMIQPLFSMRLNAMFCFLVLL